MPVGTIAVSNRKAGIGSESTNLFFIDLMHISDRFDALFPGQERIASANVVPTQSNQRPVHLSTRQSWRGEKLPEREQNRTQAELLQILDQPEAECVSGKVLYRRKTDDSVEPGPGKRSPPIFIG